MYITITIDQEESGLGKLDFDAVTEATHRALDSNPGINIISGALSPTRATWTVELTPAFFLTMMLWAKLPAHLAETMQWRPADNGHMLILRRDDGL
jgi:hypothetical protein